MKILGKKIALYFLKLLKKEVKKIRKKRDISLTVLLVGESTQQLSFVKIKKEIAKKIGIKFKFIHLKTPPSFEKFLRLLKEITTDKKTTGIIIQQPLPSQLCTESLYDYLPTEKEIEGHKKKSPFLPPLGLAVLTALKYVYKGQKIDEKLFIDVKKDKEFFKRIFHNKKVVLIGRGLTGGLPIGVTLSSFKINYIGVNSKTPDRELYYREADVIISAVGKKVLDASMLKPGVVLINVGLRKEDGRLKGDFDEKEIKNIASFYTPTPGGIGPLDVIYLYKNLLEAAKMQK